MSRHDVKHVHRQLADEMHAPMSRHSAAVARQIQRHECVCGNGRETAKTEGCKKLSGVKLAKQQANLSLRADTMKVIAEETFGVQFAFENFDSSSPQRTSMLCTVSMHMLQSSSR